jgi:hypothetical protein
MDERRMLPAAQIAALVTGLRDLRWSWTEAEIDRVAERFGWTVGIRSPRVIGLDVGFGLQTGTADLDESGHVERLHVAVGTPVAESAEGAAWLQDVFAAGVAAATEALGEPTTRRPGRFPEVRWRGPAATLGLTRMSVQVDAFLATNAYLDDFDWATARGL